MELEDNGIGDVIEMRGSVEAGPFNWMDEGVLSLRVLTTDKQTRPRKSSGVEMMWMA